MRPAARQAVERGLSIWANPSSPHSAGRRARAALEEARSAIKQALGWDGELIFTSGATEAIELALAPWEGRRLTSAVEHEAVLRAAPEAPPIAVGADGVLDRDRLSSELQARGRVMVAVQHVNSETGVIQPLADIAAQVRESGGVLLADCSQSAGRLPLPDADLIVLSAHKLGGPPGVGALLLRDLNLLQPRKGQEQGYRPGTENLPAILGFAAALEACGVHSGQPAPWVGPTAAWQAELSAVVHASGGTALCQTSPRSPLIASYAMPGISAAAQLMQFDAAGFAVSAGSACSSGAMRPSHVLQALGLPEEVAGCTIRVSYGWTNSATDNHAFAQAWQELAARARRAA